MKKAIFILISIIFCESFYAQVNFSGYLVDENNKSMKDVTINLYEENNLVSTTKWTKKF